MSMKNLVDFRRAHPAIRPDCFGQDPQIFPFRISLNPAFQLSICMYANVASSPSLTRSIIYSMIRDTGVPIMCCGEKMHEIISGITEAAGEKHIPVYEVDSGTVHVTVGSVEHPMTEEHYIEWICLETAHGIQYAHLDPTDKPKTKFALCKGNAGRAMP